jgi:hypothetical protein
MDFAGLALAILVGSARAAEVSPGAAGLDPATGRDAFLASGIAVMMACGLTSFFLAGRVTERTHVALAVLVVLVGAFCLFTLYGLAGHAGPAAGAFVFLCLLGLFKLMAQFEISRRPGTAPVDRGTDR